MNNILTQEEYFAADAKLAEYAKLVEQLPGKPKVSEETWALYESLIAPIKRDIEEYLAFRLLTQGW